MKLANWISELCAPWLVNTVLFTTLGWHTDADEVGIVAAVMTGIMPMAGIMAMKHRGKVSDHHVANASQRARVFIMIAAWLMLLGVYLEMAEAPKAIWSIFWAATLFIGSFALITAFLGLKISVHVGLWICASGYLAAAVSPWWILAVLFTPVLWWARVKLAHHTNVEAGAGALVGAAVLAFAVSL